MAKIVLASGSPRRQELLRRMGITDFTVRVPEVEEYFPAGLTPEETVCYISREKSQAVAKRGRGISVPILGDRALIFSSIVTPFSPELEYGL